MTVTFNRLSTPSRTGIYQDGAWAGFIERVYCRAGSNGRPAHYRYEAYLKNGAARCEALSLRIIKARIAEVLS